MLPGFESRGRKRGPLRITPTMPFPPPPKRGSPASNGDRLQAIIQRVESDPEYVKAQRRWLDAKDRETTRRYRENRRKNDPGFKLLMNLRSRIGAALKGAGKSRRTIELIGCSIAELKAYLESKFIAGMSWSNYGEWHVDHIVPCCAFDLRSADDQNHCFHFTNLQPLWAADNFKKSGKHPNA
jgi:hypothetical protein